MKKVYILSHHACFLTYWNKLAESSCRVSCS